MPRRFRFGAMSALILSAAIGLAACGDDGSDADAGALLKATFGPDHKIDSGRLGVDLRLDAKGLQGLSGPVRLRISGPFVVPGKGKLPKLDIALTLSGTGASLTAGAVTTGDKGWIRLQGTTYAVDDATFRQFRQGYEESAGKSSDDSGPSLKSLGVDPLRWLTGAKVEGTEDSGGAESYHITSGVDVGKLLTDINTLLGKAGRLGQGAVPTTLTEQQRRDIEASVKNARVEIWTGKEDKTLRRLRLDLDLDVPEAVRGRAGGLSTGTLSFDLRLDELNEDQTISAPKSARPFSELRALLAGSGGAASSSGGQSSTPPASTGTGTGTGTTGSSKYLQCLEKAGSDVGKIQECAALVGQ